MTGWEAGDLPRIGPTAGMGIDPSSRDDVISDLRFRGEDQHNTQVQD